MSGDPAIPVARVGRSSRGDRTFRDRSVSHGPRLLVPQLSGLATSSNCLSDIFVDESLHCWLRVSQCIFFSLTPDVQHSVGSQRAAQWRDAPCCLRRGPPESLARTRHLAGVPVARTMSPALPSRPCACLTRSPTPSRLATPGSLSASECSFLLDGISELTLTI